MTKLASIALALVSLTGVAAADISILDNRQTLTVDCAKDPNVNIAGNHATLTLNGVCENVNVSGNHATVTGSAKKIMVSGNHNTVDLDTVDVLAVPGNHNTASYKRSSDPKKPTKVSSPGKRNKVSKKK